MKGYLIQLIDEDDQYLYWSPVEIEEEIIKVAWSYWSISPFDDMEFEDWWNRENDDIQIERVFVTEIYVS